MVSPCARPCFGEVGLADEGAFGGIDNVEGRPVNVGDTLAIATRGRRVV